MNPLHLLNRLRYALSGIWYALRFDQSFRTQVLGGFVIITLFVFTFVPLTKAEILFLFLAWTLILITELQNSAFESALNRLHPEQHQDIGRSKDMAAGAVLIAGLFLVLVMGIIIFV